MHALKELLEFSNLYRDLVWEYIIKARDGRGINLEQAKFINMNSLPKKFALIYSQGVKKGCSNLVGWLKSGSKDNLA